MGQSQLRSKKVGHLQNGDETINSSILLCVIGIFFSFNWFAKQLDGDG